MTTLNDQQESGTRSPSPCLSKPCNADTPGEPGSAACAGRPASPKQLEVPGDSEGAEANHRILIVDDTPAIHEDFRKILCENPPGALEATEAVLFGEPLSRPGRTLFQLDSAHQGQEALTLVQNAVASGHPYALAFVDIRMPPGWDGIDTVTRLWQVDPDLQVVVATAYSDYSWTEMVQRSAARDNLLILKKPFDTVEVLQLAHALTAKWQLTRQSRLRLRDLDDLVSRRTEQLKQAAAHILRLNRLYAVLSKSNELALRARSIDHLCEEACRIAVETGLFRLAWVGMLDPRSHELKPLAYAGCTTDYLARVRVSSDPLLPEGRGPAGTAFREGQYNICNAAQGDPRMEPWRDAMEKFGFHSVGAFPLKVNSATAGVLVFYSTEPNFFNEEEIQLLNQLSADLSFALELVEQDQQLRLNGAALESAANSIVITDPHGTILWHNAAFTRLTGYTSDEVRGKKPSVLKSGQHDPAFYEQLWTTISSGRVWRGEIINRRKDGSLYTEEMTITPVRAGQGVITHYVAIKQDITERKRAELRAAAFSALGLRLSAAQTAKEAAQIIAEVAHQLLGWDACACDLYSESEDLASQVLRLEMKGGQRVESVADVVHKPPTPIARRAIHEGGLLLNRNRPHGVTSDTILLGHVNPESGSLLFVPIRNGGKVTGVLSIQSFAAGTYDQGSLETLQALADHCGGALDRIRTEEALHLTQEQLRQSQKLEAIGQLAGGVAHDFNNLLAVIRGNTELMLMKQRPFTPEEHECLNQVVAAADRAANLTRQLLAFGRKQVMKTQSLDLNEVVGNLTKMLKRVIGEHICLECRYAAGLPGIRGDVSMMEQALLNLVVNSRDAMPRGGKLTISSEAVTFDAAYAHNHPESRPGRFVALAVTDTGSGIPPEHLPRVFEPFFTTKEVGKGTGLGLATVYGIVKQHEGWVEAVSQVGVGSSFTLFLPVLESAPRETGEPTGNAEPLRGKETILLVEDEETVRVLTRRILVTFGYSVHECVSGAEALQLPAAQLNGVDLLLTDVVMPGGVSGNELAEKLTALKPGLRVVFTSGYSGQVLGQDTEMIRRNQVHFLPKPCAPRDILLTVRRCLDGQ